MAEVDQVRGSRRSKSGSSPAGRGSAAPPPLRTEGPPPSAAAAVPSAALSRTSRALILAGLMLAGLALRAYLAGRGSLWRDEALFLFITRLPSVGEMLDFLRFHESHPPLFYLVMRVWQAVVGTSDAAVLALPVLLGVLQIPALYFVGSRLFSRQVGLIAATLGTLSPALAEHAAYARPYSLLPLLCLLAVYFLYRGLVSGGLRPWAGYLVVNLVMLLTHNWAWPVLAAQWAVAAAALAYLFRSGKLSAAAAVAWRRGACEFLLTQMVLLGIYAALWLPALLFQAKHAGHAPGAFEPLNYLAKFIGATIGGEDPAAIGLSLLVAVVVAAAAISGRNRRADSNSDSGDDEAPVGSVSGRDRSALIWLLLLGVPLVAFAAAMVLTFRSQMMHERCLVMLAPCLLIALSAGIMRLFPSEQEQRRSSVPALAAVAVLLATYMAANYGLSLEIKSNARDLARRVQAQVRPNDLIIISPAWMAPSFNYYFPPQNEQIGFPEQTRQEATFFNDMLARLADPEAMQTTLQRITECRRAGRRVWMIMLREDITDQIPPGDRLPPEYFNAASVAIFRSNQIRHHLIRLYGPPVEGAIPADNRAAQEVLHAFLFDAGK